MSTQFAQLQKLDLYDLVAATLFQKHDINTSEQAYVYLVRCGVSDEVMLTSVRNRFRDSERGCSVHDLATLPTIDL